MLENLAMNITTSPVTMANMSNRSLNETPTKKKKKKNIQEFHSNNFSYCSIEMKFSPEIKFWLQFDNAVD